MDIFNNDHEALQIGSLTFENQWDSVIISGDVQIFKTPQGKEQAQALYDFAKQLVARLDSSELTDEPPAPMPINQVANPFD